MEEDQSPVEHPASNPPSTEATSSSLLGLGVAWARVGYGVLAFAILAFVLNLTVRPILAVRVLSPLATNVLPGAGTTPLVTPKGMVAVPSGFRAEVIDGVAQAYPEGYRLIGGKGGGMALKPTPIGMTSVFLYVFSALSSFVWMLVDIVDRRKRFVWLLPMFVCPLVMSLHALPLALYLFFARETIGHGEGVQ